MNRESKKCQNCQQEFWIEPEDFQFYEKIKVPAPTWCPECRMRRRIIWRNEKNLYKSPDSRTGKIIFSMFATGAPIPVWEVNDWWSDIWDPLSYGREYDWKKPFLVQFGELFRETPYPSRQIFNLVNSDYCANANNLKDCYLVFGAGYTEYSAYSDNIDECRHCLDTSYTVGSELNYESVFNKSCYRALFSSHCEDSQDITFCLNCVGVSNCFGCVNLRNKSYYIFNQPYSKEDYLKKIREFNPGSYGGFIAVKTKVQEFWSKFPVKYMHGRKNAGVAIGEYIWNSKNIRFSYDIRDSENLKFCYHIHSGAGGKDSYDYFRFGRGGELIYEGMQCGINVSNLRFCYQCFSNCSDLSYCISCINSSHLFGCASLRNKQYCILNKQYTKEEYEELVPRIIEHMNKMPYVDKKGRVYRYGEFFPPELSPFAYNETIAQEYFPLTKEQAVAQGYRWKDPELRQYEITIKPEDLPDHIKDVKDDILNQVIGCAHEQKCNEQCTTAFKIIPEELAFYRRMNLPLPRLCPNCRHYQRLKQRNPLKLWHRRCQCAGQKSENGVYQNTISHQHGTNNCPNEFETSYAPDRKEIVYCEQCYQAEVA